jgi:glycosyltransferase involved in cell wall biosynthesis
MAETGRVAFVPPRFGRDLVGGSEAVSREAALGLAGRGWDVEILTTCAVDHFTWVNELPPGTSVEDGLTVRRFPTVHTPSRAAHKAELVIQGGGVPSLDEQVSWLSYRFQVPKLFHHILRHQHEYDALIYSPYLFWTTAVCAPVTASQAIVIPCLHDEHYARLDLFRPVLADPAAVWFLSEPEHQLAHRLGPVAPGHQVTGAGVTVPSSYDPEGFRARHGLRRPFLLYSGRREGGKGWDWLMHAFKYTLEHGDPGLDLATTGVGPVLPPPEMADRVIDLGFLDHAERDNAMAAAATYVQPSRMESFSRTIMEAWLAGTPVIASAASEVVAWHCHRSGGGITYSDECEFATCVLALASSPARGAELADRGRRYVLEHYTWDAVLDLMEADLRRLRS